MKILILGNEFVEKDSLIPNIFSKVDFGVLKKDFIFIKDSFKLIEVLEMFSKEDLLVVDVVENLKKIKFLDIDEIEGKNIVSAHDFDAGYVLKLLRPNIKILGIPLNADEKSVVNFLSNFFDSI